MFVGAYGAAGIRKPARQTVIELHGDPLEHWPAGNTAGVSGSVVCHW